MLGLLFRVKFLVVRDRGPMAETEWSSETRLQQGMGPGVQVKLQGWGPRDLGTPEDWGWVGRNGPAPSQSEPPLPSCCLQVPLPRPPACPAPLGLG